MAHHLFQENRPIPRPKKNGNGITKVLYLKIVTLWQNFKFCSLIFIYNRHSILFI